MHWGLDVQLNQLKTHFAETVFTGNFEVPASFGIGLSRKDVGLATDLGRQLDVPMPIAALVEQMMIHAISRGWSEQSTASLFRLQEEAAGVEVRKRLSVSNMTARSSDRAESPQTVHCERTRIR